MNKNITHARATNTQTYQSPTVGNYANQRPSFRFPHRSAQFPSRLQT